MHRYHKNICYDMLTKRKAQAYTGENMALATPKKFILTLYACTTYTMGVQAVEDILYVINSATSEVYAANPTTGQYSTLGTFPPVPNYTYNGLGLVNNVLYSPGWTDGGLVGMDRLNGSSYFVTPNPVTPLADIGIANDTLAYVLSNDYDIYSINLQNGQSTLVTPSPIISGPLVTIGNLALTSDNQTAYVVGFNDLVYRVNLQNGASSAITSTPIPAGGLQGIALANDQLAYVVGANDNVYAVDLTTGTATLITPTPVAGNPSLYFIILDPTSDNTIAYAGGFNNGQVYKIDLQNGSYIPLLTPPPPPFFGFSSAQGLAYFIASIPTANLHGNNRIFANYLNTNAPLSTMKLFTPLNGEALPKALESAAPTRNAFATFASQNGYLASSQVFTDHMRRRRFASSPLSVSKENIASNDLLADASGKFRRNKKTDKTPPQGFITGWVSGFGEYAKEKKQQQTPAFSAGLGGAVAAVDYNCVSGNVVGSGAAYVHTHVDEKEGAGHANVDQGYLTVYGTLHATKWYSDLGLWGGYYHADNHRKISFPGFNATAKSSIHGWQLAPHIEVGYQNVISNPCLAKVFGIDPFLMGDWVANWEHGFREHGASPLNAKQNGRFCSLFRGETGLRFYETVCIDWGQIIFEEKASYAYQKMIGTGVITAFLVGSPGAFTVTTLASAQNLGVAEFSMLFHPNNRKMPYVDLRYQGEFGSHYQSHQGILEIGKVF